MEVLKTLKKKKVSEKKELKKTKYSTRPAWIRDRDGEDVGLCE